MKMENEQEVSGTCADEIQLHKTDDGSISKPGSSLQQNSDDPVDVKDTEDKTQEQRTSSLEAVKSSSSIPVAGKEDHVDIPPSEGEVKDNLELSSKHETSDLNLQPLSCRNIDNCDVKIIRKVSSESEVSTVGKDELSSSLPSIAKGDCKNSLNTVVENVDLPDSGDVSKEVNDSGLQTPTTEIFHSAGLNGSTIINVSPPEGSGDSVSTACQRKEVNNSESCISTAEKTGSSCAQSSDTGEVAINCLHSSSLSEQANHTCSLGLTTEVDNSVSDEKINDKQMTTSCSKELSVDRLDNSVTRKLDISPVQSEKIELEPSGKTSPKSDNVHMSDSGPAPLGDTSEPSLTAATESNTSDCNNSEIAAPQSFTDSNHDTVSQAGAVKIKADGMLDSLDVSLEAEPSEVDIKSIPREGSSAVSLDNVSNVRDATQTLKESDDNSLPKVGLEKDIESENVHNKVSLSLDKAQCAVHSEVDDTVHSCAFEESCSQSVSESSVVNEAGMMDDVTSDGSKNIDNCNTMMETDKESDNKKVDESTVTLGHQTESQEVMEHTNQVNDLSPNSCTSTQDHSEPCVVSSQDEVATGQPETLTEEQHCQSPSGQLNASSESNVKSEAAVPLEVGKSSHSPKEYSVADSESNSWDNSYTLHTQTQSGNHPASSGSTQHPAGSVPGSLADTESSNMSFASSSTSTTQPLDMGDIIKAGMDAEPVLLPEATSNVEDGSGAQLAVDEWCCKQAGASKQQGTDDTTGVDGVKFNSSNVPMENEDLDFDWEEYMEDTKSSPAPDAAFPHVEASLRSNFEKGMKFEVAHGSDNKYWIATVVMPCGQLLRLRYDGSESDSSKDFWCDAFTSDIHPLGWCRQNEKTLEPPDDLKEKFPDWHNYVQTTLAQATTASDKLLGGVLGTAAVDQIKQNMLVEVQDENDLTHVWIARVLENIGGRLLLRYEGTDSARQDFWLFYLHFRIHPMGWAKEMEMSYGPPEAVAEEWSRDEGWKAVLEKAQSDAQTLAFPADVLADQEMVLTHAFKQGWKLEVLHPVSKNRICPGTVIQVYNDTYFLVQIDDHEPSLDDSPVQICCHGGSRNIFPINWAEKQGLNLQPPHGWQKEFDWQNYLKEMEAEPAPPDVFTLDCDEVKLEKGMKLEAANPEQPGQICVATVMQVNKPLVLIHLESSAELKSYHMVDCQSQEIFPVGWCESNSYPLQPPNKAFFTRRQKKSIEEPPPTAKKSSSSSHSKSRHGDKGGIWCPKIYFNHRCFSGPYLSKGRIAELPKSVGPGPVTLVMKEVLSMLINVAYKSSRVLRELQMDGDPDPSLHQQVLKAKYKGKSYRAVVELCKTSDQVVDFCKNICIKLECCPYLFSPTFINGQCPENCSQQSKTKYTAYVGKKKKKVGRPPGGHSNLEGGPKKPGKRRKRKRIGFFKVKKTLSNPELTTKEEEVDELESVLHEESSNSTTASLDLVSSNGIHRRKRKYTRHVAPPLEMKTRGVKLPRYSIERRTRQPRLQLDSPIKAGVIDTAGAITEIQLQQAGRKSAFVPVKRESSLVLDTNPLLWSVGEVVEYIKTTDCAPLARLFKEEEIDGQALLLLTLPTVQELMEVKLGPAIKLCHLVEKLKIAFYEQYAI